MSLSIPYTFVGGPGNKVIASQVNANFQAVAGKFSQGVGGISDSDVSTTAAINGSKLSNVQGNRIPYDRIEDGAIVTSKIGANQVTGGTTGSLALTTITNANIAAATILNGNMKLLTNSVSMGNVNLPTGGDRAAFNIRYLPSGANAPTDITLITPIAIYLSNVSGTALSADAYLPTVSLNVGWYSATLGGTITSPNQPYYDVTAKLHTFGSTLTATINFVYLASA